MVELISLLQVGRGQNVSSLAQGCGVCRRTIFRDLDVLRAASVPVEFDGEGGRYRLRGSHLLPPTNFTPQEALSLLVLCHELGRAGGIPCQGPAAKAAVKLESNLPPRLRDYLRDATQAVRIRLDASNPLASHESVYDQLLVAAAQRRQVRIEYDSLTEWSRISTRLSPYRLLFSRRSWYIVGRSSLHRGVRTFNLSRVHSLEPLDTGFNLPRGFSIERYLRNAWHLIPERGGDQHVVIRFEKMVAQNVAEVAWHKTQRVRLLSDGRLDFHVTVSGLHEISWWVLGYGDQAEVLRPKKLRDLVVQRAQSMLKRYEPS
ncbi:MAG TPA: YafY family protein [Pirellulales bacterium]|nr:YafY family protein [Pirellulales bacterium]